MQHLSAHGDVRELALGSTPDVLAFDAEPGDRLLVVEARLGDRVASVRRPEVALGPERDVALVGDLPRAGKIRVVDARDGTDLSEVRLLPWHATARSTRFPPLEALLGSVRTQRAPLALPRNEPATRYWIGAEGFAWRRIEYGAASGDPIYALAPGAELTVRASVPHDGAWDYSLRLFRADRPGTAAQGELWVDEPLTPGRPLRFPGLAAGAWRAVFVAGAPSLADVVLAERSLELGAGARDELTIDLDALWQPHDFGKVALNVLLEDPGDASVLELRVESPDASEPAPRNTPLAWLRPGPFGDLRWGSGPVPVGRARITAVPGGASVDVDVTGGSVTYDQLRIPALPRLRLWAVDDTTGEAPDEPLVVWRPAGSDRWRVASTRIDEGGWVFPLAAGDVELGVRANGYRTARLERTIAAGWNEELVSLHRVEPREIVVRLRSGEHSLPASEDVWSSIDVLDDRGRSALLGMRLPAPPVAESVPDERASSILLVDGPGAYRVSLGSAPAFVRPVSAEVVVGDGEAELELDLPSVHGSR
ncbi:MAG: hypothetical protein AAF682_20735 [Planctomycetota bacterium]